MIPPQHPAGSAAAALREEAFATFPILHTERLTLRELRPDEDTAAAFLLYSDVEVTRYMGKAPHTDPAQTREYLDRNAQLFPEREGFKWAITLNAQEAGATGASRADPALVGRFIGSCGHWRLMKEHLRSEIGYDLLPACWGRGYMAEALRAVLRFGFEELGLHSVEAQIDPDNAPSRRVLERAGFRQEGLQRENFRFAGRFSDTGLYALLGREFRAARP